VITAEHVHRALEQLDDSFGTTSPDDVGVAVLSLHDEAREAFFEEFIGIRTDSIGAVPTGSALMGFMVGVLACREAEADAQPSHGGGDPAF
jgi:hypothetical protein